MADLKDLFTAVVEMQEDTAMELTNKYLDEGVPALDIFNCYQEALEEIGKRFEKQLYFIPELIMSGEMMKAASEILKPHLSRRPRPVAVRRSWARCSWPPCRATSTTSARTSPP